MSIFAIVLDHASPAQWTNGDFSQVGIASLSRELASNDWTATPFALMGSDLDRNVELILPAPFDLEKISDADLEKEILKRKAVVLKNSGGAGA